MSDKGSSPLVFAMRASRRLGRGLRRLAVHRLALGYGTWAVVVVAWCRRRVGGQSVAEASAHEAACAVGGAFVLLTLPLAAHLSLQHLMNFVEPRRQSQTVRIIWTVPVYSLSAWLCLRFPERAPYVHGVREMYESYVLYCFLQ